VGIAVGHNSIGGMALTLCGCRPSDRKQTSDRAGLRNALAVPLPIRRLRFAGASDFESTRQETQQHAQDRPTIPHHTWLRLSGLRRCQFEKKHGHNVHGPTQSFVSVQANSDADEEDSGRTANLWLRVTSSCHIAMKPPPFRRVMSVVSERAGKECKRA